MTSKEVQNMNAIGQTINKNMEKNAYQSESRPVGALITSTLTVPPTMVVKQVSDIFSNTMNLDALAVVDGKEPVALVTRSKLLLKLFQRFGFELYRKNPIISIADTDPLIIDEHEQLNRAIEKALDRNSSVVYDDVIVVDGNGCFKGLLSIKQLVSQQSSALANTMVQKEIAAKRASDLEKVNQIKSQFIAHVTHELRSPVNAIIGLAELLRMASEHGSNEQIKERLSLMISSAISLRALITNILDLSKIEAGKMDVVSQSFDVAALIDEIAEITRVLIGSKPVTVEVRAPTMPVLITSDPVKLRQIILNITSNAAKFTEQGKITMTLSIIGGRLEITVADTGIGIKREHLEGLFSPFKQLGNSQKKRYEGTGLGLTISRNLAELIGGTISVSSVFEKGTTFTLSLPFRQIERQGGIYVAE